MRIAVIGIGSNSLRLLVADRESGIFNAILRKREGLRVFASLDQDNNITEEMIEKTCGSVAMLRQTALHAGAKAIRLFATSAVRDAKNQQELTDCLLRETGLQLEIISGDMEAKLSFIGATENISSGMIDIGGGSTEIVIGRHDAIDFACSLQAGAVRLFRQIPITGAADIVAITRLIQELLIPYNRQLAQLKTPAAWVGVGGTLTAVASCIQNTDWMNHDTVDGYIAARSEVRRVTEALAEMPLEKRCTLPCIPPDRADIIVHGFSILLGCMEELNIDQIIVSRQTNLDGYLKLMPMDE